MVSNVYIHACIISQCYYELIYFCFVLFMIIDSHSFFSHDHNYVYTYMCLSVYNCIKDRLPDRHSCLHLYPCIIKFSQSVSQLESVPGSEWVLNTRVSHRRPAGSDTQVLGPKTYDCLTCLCVPVSVYLSRCFPLLPRSQRLSPIRVVGFCFALYLVFPLKEAGRK